MLEWDIKNKIRQTKSEEKWTLCQKATDYWIGMMTKMQNSTFAYGNCVHFLFYLLFFYFSRFPDRVLKPEDFEMMNQGRGRGYRPQIGFTRGSGYRGSKDMGPANRMVRWVIHTGL